MIDGRGWGALDYCARIVALSGIIDYILADREMRQWFWFQLAGGEPGVAPDGDDCAGGAYVIDVVGVRLIIRVVKIWVHDSGICDYRQSFDGRGLWFRPRGIQYFVVDVPALTADVLILQNVL